MDQPHGTKTPLLSVGSLHALRLGAQTLDDLASLVNWGNSADFAPPRLLPWVEIGPSPSDFDSSQPNSDDSTASNSTTSHNEAVQASEAEDDPIAIVAGMEGEDSDSLIAPRPSNHEETTEDPGEFSALPLGELEPDEIQAATVPAPSTDDLVLVDTSQSFQADASNHELESLAAHPEEDAVSVVGLASSKSLDGHRNDTPVTSKRHVQAQESTGKVMTTTAKNATTAESSEYLRRLESLVLGLNAQLAKQAMMDASKPLDEITWLRQRVIDLSLENQELHDRLKSQAM